MAYIRKKEFNPIMNTELLLLEPSKGEWEDGNYTKLETDSFKYCSFDELEELGNWLIEKSKEFRKIKVGEA